MKATTSKTRKKLFDMTRSKMLFFGTSLNTIRLCLEIVFVFYFQNLVFRNIKIKEFSCIF